MIGLPDSEINHVVAIAHKVANEMRWTGLEYEDMVQDALLRVMRWRHAYDPARGTVGTFAWRLSRTAIASKWLASRWPKRGGGRPDLRLDAPLHAANDDDARTLYETLAAPEAPAYDDSPQHVRAALEHVLRTEPYLQRTRKGEKHRQAMRRDVRVLLRRRLLADDPATLEECGEEMGCTREWVRQREKVLLDVLREEMVARCVAA